ncbi:MAG TPA: hypothetical protein VFE54_10525 [Mucilaginibacter sp.]|jgi:hypothetical protein|nr:hypothetical protein [Mucilaginibacter sp.]
MIILYRAISEGEKENFDNGRQFRTAKNTLEAKQFFKSRTAVRQFVASSVTQDYDPPYVYLLVVGLDEASFAQTEHTQMKLDGYEAVNVEEDDLAVFNNCVKFVREELL